MYNMKEAYLLHITLLQWSKNLVKFFVSAMFTLLPLSNLDYVSADEITEVHVC